MHDQYLSRYETESENKNSYKNDLNSIAAKAIKARKSSKID